MSQEPLRWTYEVKAISCDFLDPEMIEALDQISTPWEEAAIGDLLGLKFLLTQKDHEVVPEEPHAAFEPIVREEAGAREGSFHQLPSDTKKSVALTGVLIQRMANLAGMVELLWRGGRLTPMSGTEYEILFLRGASIVRLAEPHRAVMHDSTRYRQGSTDPTRLGGLAAIVVQPGRSHHETLARWPAIQDAFEVIKRVPEPFAMSSLVLTPEAPTDILALS